MTTITVKPKKARGLLNEVGFTHKGGALILQNGDSILVLGGYWGNYTMPDPTGEIYELWRSKAVDVILSGDTVEIKVE